MKITVNPEHTTKETPYPKLMISRVSKMIILMVRPYEGTVLRSDNTHNQWMVGQHNSNWSILNFEDYKGSITLENTHEA